MEIDLNEVFVFIKVVQEGSFSQAAKKLGMPNSTVSAKVSSLEKRLGVTLIQRTTRKLSITEPGKAYFKRCIQGIEEIESAESELANVQGEPQGLLRITTPVELGSSILPEILAEFSNKFPKVRTEAILTDRHVDLLSESVDLAIRAGELKDSTLIAKRLGSSYFVPVASPKYLKTKGTPVHPRDLKNHQCLVYTPLGVDDWKLVSSKGGFNVPLPGRIIANDLKLLRILAVKGEGIALMPTHAVYADCQSGKLVRILPEWQTATAPVHFVYPAQKYVTPKLSAFMNLATASLKKQFAEFEL